MIWRTFLSLSPERFKPGFHGCMTALTGSGIHQQ